MILRINSSSWVVQDVYRYNSTMLDWQTKLHLHLRLLHLLPHPHMLAHHWMKKSYTCLHCVLSCPKQLLHRSTNDHLRKVLSKLTLLLRWCNLPQDVNYNNSTKKDAILHRWYSDGGLEPFIVLLWISFIYCYYHLPDFIYFTWDWIISIYICFPFFLIICTVFCFFLVASLPPLFSLV